MRERLQKREGPECFNRGPLRYCSDTCDCLPFLELKPSRKGAVSRYLNQGLEQFTDSVYLQTPFLDTLLLDNGHAGLLTRLANRFASNSTLSHLDPSLRIPTLGLHVHLLRLYIF